MKIIENIGTWKIEEIANGSDEIILINIKDKFYNNHKYPLFAKIENRIWRGELIKKGSNESTILYNKIAFEEIKKNLTNIKLKF